MTRELLFRRARHFLIFGSLALGLQACGEGPVDPGETVPPDDTVELDSVPPAAVTDLAVAYSLVTNYTSMVVVGPDRKNHYGIGDANAKRRGRERQAAAKRTQRGNTVQTMTKHQPLAGPTAAHAPSRSNRSGGSYGGGSGRGKSGGGAIGPLGLLPFVGLAFVAARRRRRR